MPHYLLTGDISPANTVTILSWNIYAHQLADMPLHCRFIKTCWWSFLSREWQVRAYQKVPIILLWSQLRWKQCKYVLTKCCTCVTCWANKWINEIRYCWPMFCRCIFIALAACINQFECRQNYANWQRLALTVGWHRVGHVNGLMLRIGAVYAVSLSVSDIAG